MKQNAKEKKKERRANDSWENPANLKNLFAK